jgi:hypothetical protein
LNVLEQVEAVVQVQEDWVRILVVAAVQAAR